MRRRRSLLDLLHRLGPRAYDFMYRRGAPWESGPRAELVALIESGRVSPGRAIDLGCGTGADSIYLAARGFEVTGVDLSPVAIEKAQRNAAEAGRRPRFVTADLLNLPADIQGPFDFLFDGGTLDDLPPRLRPDAAKVITRLAATEARFLMWCFYAHDHELPRLSFAGASRWGAPAIEPGEEIRLFGTHWSIERLAQPPVGSGAAAFLMTRNTATPGGAIGI